MYNGGISHRTLKGSEAITMREDFYDLPSGSYFKAKFNPWSNWSETTYHKASQGTAHDINDPSHTYVGSDFYSVMLTS